MYRTVTLLSLLCVSALVLAQTPQTRDQINQPGNQQTMTPDAKFVMGVTSGGNFEVQAGRLALMRSQDPTVKKIAQKMIDEHSKTNQQLMAITNKQQAPGQIQPPGSTQRLDPIHAAMLQKLNSLNGEEFDDCFIGMQVLAHEEAVMCFRKAIKKVQDPQLKDFAQKTLPVLRQHLEMVKSACESSLEHGNYESMKFPLPDDKDK